MLFNQNTYLERKYIKENANNDTFNSIFNRKEKQDQNIWKNKLVNNDVDKLEIKNLNKNIVFDVNEYSQTDILKIKDKNLNKNIVSDVNEYSQTDVLKIKNEIINKTQEIEFKDLNDENNLNNKENKITILDFEKEKLNKGKKIINDIDNYLEKNEINDNKFKKIVPDNIKKFILHGSNTLNKTTYKDNFSKTIN